MPLYGKRKDILSLELVEYIKTSLGDFCENKFLSREEGLELFDHRVVSRIVKDLGLKVKVEELVEEPVTVTTAKKTPLEIIDRIVTEAPNNKGTKNPSLCERDLLY